MHQPNTITERTSNMSHGATGASLINSNKVLKNTYMLLALTLAFSAMASGVAMAMNMAPLNPWITLIVYFGLLFAVHKTENSAMGIVMVFALTGFLGLTLGPMLNYFIATDAGSQIVMLALGGTAAIFFGLSALALITQKDFSFMGKFLFTGLLVAFIAGIANIFFQIPALHLAVSSMFLVLSSGVLLYQTSEIIHGGETNYIRATVTLYVSLYNIFANLLMLLSAFTGGDD